MIMPPTGRYMLRACYLIREAVIIDVSSLCKPKDNNSLRQKIICFKERWTVQMQYEIKFMASASLNHYICRHFMKCVVNQSLQEPYWYSGMLLGSRLLRRLLIQKLPYIRVRITDVAIAIVLLWWLGFCSEEFHLFEILVVQKRPYLI